MDIDTEKKPSYQPQYLPRYGWLHNRNDNSKVVLFELVFFLKRDMHTICQYRSERQASPLLTKYRPHPFLCNHKKLSVIRTKAIHLPTPVVSKNHENGKY